MLLGKPTLSAECSHLQAALSGMEWLFLQCGLGRRVTRARWRLAEGGGIIGIPDNATAKNLRNPLSQCQLVIVGLWQSLFSARSCLS